MYAKLLLTLERNLTNLPGSMLCSMLVGECAVGICEVIVGHIK